jgi:hypothetical protein
MTVTTQAQLAKTPDRDQGGNLMRSTLRISALVLLLFLLLVPLAVQASGPCPDDPEAFKDCNPEAPPFYVVINRSFQDLDRAGTGCQPIILENPDCEDCCGEDEDCMLAEADLEQNVCPMLAEEVDWMDQGQTEVVYQMCCDCSESDEGAWTYRLRLLQEDGTCPIDPDNPGCYEGLPPGTGIDLPAPVIVAGLALIGAVLVAGGLVMHRRSLQSA